MIRTFISLFLLFGITLLTAQEPVRSPWDHHELELRDSVQFPIKYPTTFTRERDMFNYNPRFVSQKITFKPNNTPVMRFGLHGAIGTHKTPYGGKVITKENYIQYLGENGQWHITTSHIKSLKQFLGLKKTEELHIFSGERISDMVEFDDNGYAYTLVETSMNTKKHSYLLFSKDAMKTWQVLELPKHSTFRLESDVFHNDRQKPPVILMKSKQLGLCLFNPELTKKGRLKLGHMIRLVQEPKAHFRDVMAGAGNATVTTDNKTFVTYMVAEKREGIKGTPHYIVSYNHRTKEVSKPHFLGESGHRVDAHNAPVIALDSNKNLHVLLGTHWHSMVYYKSKNPMNISQWNEPYYIEGNGDNRWSRNGLTYPGFIIDHKNTIHLVVRGRNSEFVKNDTADPALNKNWSHILDYALVYIRKKENGDWESRKDLVVPKHKNYSNWYHKISIDKKGNIYLAYFYYAHNLNDLEKREYHSKWPNENLSDQVQKQDKLAAHDPVLIHTYNQGEQWHITTTSNLFDNLKHK